ncbi:NAD(P)H-binding protein [Cellulomonas oligotrophica]|uniref:NmrA family transcriptional regulator n=1 Tax=Cellulomonas oligotrophica TaxID=931536 RepID=A0A7Y9K022_9CELL|nr:NAD(P)H-binding protein [Cellulomonas oligotrophica]NYD86855.1 uncharacterized protein YbjT (DUF2867 family) [Cellulomonas oligotrophica]GIG32360.1 NmrA family transcriptional regulator [Cellulomonas oligotrophica]
MTTDPTPRPVTVIGATGKTGRRVVDRLRARAVPVRAASRTGTTRFDWDDTATWEPALAGAGAVYVAYAPDLAVPGAPETVERLAALAQHLHVGRLVLLSGRGETEAQRAERLVRAAFDGATVVRCAFFAQNFSESFLLDDVRAGRVVLPVGDVREPFVDLEDVADVAVAALTDDAHRGLVHELTGPRAVTFAEAVAVLADAAGRPVELVPVTLEEFTAGLRAQGVPDDAVALLAYLFTEVLDGRGEAVTDGVRRALGREATDLAAYARRERDAWRTADLPG